jgi:hypothetical protein
LPGPKTRDKKTSKPIKINPNSEVSKVLEKASNVKILKIVFESKKYLS